MTVKKLRIQGFDVAVIVEDLASQGMLGRCSTTNQKIVVSSGIPEDVKNSTILHEAVHYISDLFNIDLSESQVCILETAFFNFIKSNPAFIKSLL